MNNKEKQPMPDDRDAFVAEALLGSVTAEGDEDVEKKERFDKAMEAAGAGVVSSEDAHAREREKRSRDERKKNAAQKFVEEVRAEVERERRVADRAEKRESWQGEGADAEAWRGEAYDSNTNSLQKTVVFLEKERQHNRAGSDAVEAVRSLMKLGYKTFGEAKEAIEMLGGAQTHDWQLSDQLGLLSEMDTGAIEDDFLRIALAELQSLAQEKLKEL